MRWVRAPGLARRPGVVTAAGGTGNYSDHV